MNQVQGSPWERSEEQQETGQEAQLQKKLQRRSEVHPGDWGRGRTGGKLPTTKVQGPFRKQGQTCHQNIHDIFNVNPSFQNTSVVCWFSVTQT